MHCRAEWMDVRGNGGRYLYKVLKMRSTILFYLPHYCPLTPPLPSSLTSQPLTTHRWRPPPILQPHSLAHHRRGHRHSTRLVHRTLHRSHLPEHRSRDVRAQRRGILGNISQYVLAPTAPIPGRWTKQ
jgi:hypothetical protein